MEISVENDDRKRLSNDDLEIQTEQTTDQNDDAARGQDSCGSSAQTPVTPVGTAAVAAGASHVQSFATCDPRVQRSLRVSLLEAQCDAARGLDSCGSPAQTPVTPVTPGGATIGIPPIDPKTGFRYQWTDPCVIEAGTLPVRCKSLSGELHKSKLGSGGRGKCILVKGRWYTPSEFEAMSGRGNCKDWKRSIRYGGRTLQCLVEDGILQPHATSCICAACCDDASVTGPIRLFVPYRRKKPKDGDQQPRLASDDTSEHASGPPSPQDCLSSVVMLTPMATSSNTMTRTYAVGNVAQQSTPETITVMDTMGVATAAAEIFTPGTHTPASTTIDFAEHRQWWQLEEMVNTLINYGQQVKQLLAQVKEQSMASKEGALVQLRSQLEQEKHQAVSRASQAAHTQATTRTNVDSFRRSSPNCGGDYEDPAKKCANCGREAFSMCSVCHGVGYCSAFCQEKDWKNHASECNSSGVELDQPAQTHRSNSKP